MRKKRNMNRDVNESVDREISSLAARVRVW